MSQYKDGMHSHRLRELLFDTRNIHYSSFDNMKVWTFLCVWLENAIHALKITGLGIFDTLNGEVYQQNPKITCVEKRHVIWRIE